MSEHFVDEKPETPPVANDGTIQVRVSKRGLIIGTLVGVLGLGAFSGWYYVTGTPEYSLYQLKKAVASKNELAVEHYLDQQALVDDTSDRVWSRFDAKIAEYVAQSSANASGWEALGTSIGMAMLQNMKPAMKSALSSSVNKSISDLIYGDSTGEASASAMPEFHLVRVDRMGNKAMVTLQVSNKPEVPKLQVSMGQNPDRTWKITNLSQKTIDSIFSDKMASKAVFSGDPSPGGMQEDAKNREVQSNGHAVQMALEMYAVDHSSVYPKTAEEFDIRVIHSKEGYLADDSLPKTPWGGRQEKMLQAEKCGLAIPPAKPTPLGTELGNGNESHVVEKVTDFGSLAFASGGKSHEQYVLYGIGRKGDKAVVTFVVHSY